MPKAKWIQVRDASLAVPINRTETNQAIVDELDGIVVTNEGFQAPDRFVWTKTSPHSSMNLNLNDCQNWTYGDYSGWVSGGFGSNQQTDSFCAVNGNTFCNTPFHLYCVEQ